MVETKLTTRGEGAERLLLVTASTEEETRGFAHRVAVATEVEAAGKLAGFVDAALDLILNHNII